MPDFTLSDALEEAYASAPSSEAVLHTLEIRHPDFTQPIRVVRDHQDFEAYLERYPDGHFAVLARKRLAALTAPDGLGRPWADRIAGRRPPALSKLRASWPSRR